MADDQVKYSELLVKDEDVFGALIKEINDAKKAMADLKQEAAGLAGSVKSAGTATRDQQQAVAEQLLYLILEEHADDEHRYHRHQNLRHVVLLLIPLSRGERTDK